jgi:hypothetical protein
VRCFDAFPRLIEWVCMALVVASPAIVEQGKLRERLTPEVMAVVFPGSAGGRQTADPCSGHIIDTRQLHLRLRKVAGRSAVAGTEIPSVRRPAEWIKGGPS